MTPCLGNFGSMYTRVSVGVLCLAPFGACGATDHDTDETGGGPAMGGRAGSASGGTREDGGRSEGGALGDAGEGGRSGSGGAPILGDGGTAGEDAGGAFGIGGDMDDSGGSDSAGGSVGSESRCVPKRFRTDYFYVCQEDLKVLEGVTEIEGNVSIGFGCPVTNIAALNCLERLEGDLEFEDGPEDLDALGRLEEVTGWFVLSAREAELPALVRVGEGLTIGPDTATFVVPSLETVGGFLGLGSEALVATAFPRLVSVGSTLGLPVEAVADFEFPALESVDAALEIEGEMFGRVSFPRLRRIRGSLHFTKSAHTKLPTFPSLTEVGGLVLSDVAVTDLHGLDALEHLDTVLSLQRNPNLETLAGLDQIKTLGSLVAVENPKLETLEALWNTDGELRELVIENNAVLHNLDGLEGANASTDMLRIESNPALENIDALSSLESALVVIVRNNPLLEDLAGFRRLRSARSLQIAGLDSLTTTADLEALVDVELDVAIENCPALTELGFFPNVGASFALWNVPALQSLGIPDQERSVGSVLSVSQTGLTRLEGFNKLRQLESLDVSGNANLESLRDLSAIEALSNYLRITENPVLPSCEAEWLRDHIGESNIGGPIDLQGNTGSGNCP